MGEHGSRVGLDPVDRVFVLENHDEAYQIWRSMGVRERTLVHIDAHHDMWWISDRASISIANFVCPALQHAVVNEIVWVVPDATWETAHSRAAVRRHVKDLSESYPGGPGVVQVDDRRLSTVVLGKQLTVCSIDSMPEIAGKVLLDIDVDFLVIPCVAYGERDRQGALPWCWPDDLLARVSARGIRTDLATIAYSVEGSYTPLKWKYLGDEVALRLREPEGNAPALRGMALIGEAAVAARLGDLQAAEAHYHEAWRLLPASAAPSYHLAHLCLETGRAAEGRAFYERALALDPSYRTPYNNAGLQHLGAKRFRAAEREFRRALTLDPQDAYAHFGLGRLAAGKRRWGEAEAWLERAVALEERLVDAWRDLGDVLTAQQRRGAAIAAYERSLKLALAGQPTLEGPIATDRALDRLADVDHCRIHARLARLYELEGAAARAISGYRIAIAGGHNGVLVRSRLARLHLKQNQWRESAHEAWAALGMIPVTLRRGRRRLYRHMRRVIRDGYAFLSHGGKDERYRWNLESRRAAARAGAARPAQRDPGAPRVGRAGTLA